MALSWACGALYECLLGESWTAVSAAVGACREVDAEAVESERVVNRQIREVAGSRRTVVLTPDFETVAGFKSSGRSRKPRKAWRQFQGTGDVPPELRVAVEKVVRAARS